MLKAVTNCGIIIKKREIMEEKINIFEVLNKIKSDVNGLDERAFSKELEIQDIILNYNKVSETLSSVLKAHKYLADNLKEEFSKRWQIGFYLQSTTPKKIVSDKDSYISGIQLYIGLEHFTFLKINISYEFYVDEKNNTIQAKVNPTIKGQRVQLSLDALYKTVNTIEDINEISTEGKKSLALITNLLFRETTSFEQLVETESEKHLSFLDKYLSIKYPKVNITKYKNTLGELIKEQLLFIKYGEENLNSKYQMQSKGIKEILVKQEQENLQYSLNKDLRINEKTKKKVKI